MVVALWLLTIVPRVALCLDKGSITIDSAPLEQESHGKLLRREPHLSPRAASASISPSAAILTQADKVESSSILAYAPEQFAVIDADDDADETRVAASGGGAQAAADVDSPGVPYLTLGQETAQDQSFFPMSNNEQNRRTGTIASVAAQDPLPSVGSVAVVENVQDDHPRGGVAMGLVRYEDEEDDFPDAAQAPAKCSAYTGNCLDGFVLTTDGECMGPTCTDSDIESCCVAKCRTIGTNGVGPGVPCKFPFTYELFDYSSCTDAGDNTALWCMTEPTGSSNWGDCSEDCPREANQLSQWRGRRTISVGSDSGDCADSDRSWDSRWEDSEQNGCAYFDDFPAGCAVSQTAANRRAEFNYMTARDVCCSCGGGSSKQLKKSELLSPNLGSKDNDIIAEMDAVAAEEAQEEAGDKVAGRPSKFEKEQQSATHMYIVICLASVLGAIALVAVIVAMIYLQRHGPHKLDGGGGADVSSGATYSEADPAGEEVMHVAEGLAA